MIDLSLTGSHGFPLSHWPPWSSSRSLAPIVEAAPLEGRTVECSVIHESSVSNSEKMVTDATSLSAAIMDPSKFSSTVCLPRTAPEGPSSVVHHQSGHVSTPGVVIA